MQDPIDLGREMMRLMETMMLMMGTAIALSNYYYYYCEITLL
jgi:hypothetical protein